MKKKGFTLIELIAVLAILTLLIMISVPMAMTYVEKTRKSTFTNNMHLIIKAVDDYNVDVRDKEFLNGTKELEISVLPIKNKNQYVSGTVSYKENKVVLKDVSNGSYCGNGTIDDLIITKGSC